MNRIGDSNSFETSLLELNRMQGNFDVNTRSKYLENGSRLMSGGWIRFRVDVNAGHQVAGSEIDQRDARK
jgi:hypothetical protein